MQKGLPRPDVLTTLQDPASLTSQSSPLEAAEALLQAELIALLQYEAAKFPVKKKGKRKRGDEAEPAPLGPLGPWEDFSVSPSYTTNSDVERELCRQDLGCIMQSSSKFLNCNIMARHFSF